MSSISTENRKVKFGSISAVEQNRSVAEYKSMYVTFIY